jgi:hypothetical protein
MGQTSCGAKDWLNTSAEHDQRAFTLTGPEAVDFAEGGKGAQ